MKKIQLFLKYLVLMLFLIVWIIIMFFTDYMNSQSFKLYCMFVVGGWMCILNLAENLCTGCKVIYCRKSISINTYSSSFHQIIMFLIKKVKIRNRLFCCVFFLLFFYPHMLEYNQSSFSIATCAVVGTLITDMTICSVNM